MLSKIILVTITLYGKKLSEHITICHHDMTWGISQASTLERADESCFNLHCSVSTTQWDQKLYEFEMAFFTIYYSFNYL